MFKQWFGTNISIIHTRFTLTSKFFYYLRMNDCKYVGSWQRKIIWVHFRLIEFHILYLILNIRTNVTNGRAMNDSAWRRHTVGSINATHTYTEMHNLKYQYAILNLKWFSSTVISEDLTHATRLNVKLIQIDVDWYIPHTYLYANNNLNGIYFESSTQSLFKVLACNTLQVRNDLSTQLKDTCHMLFNLFKHVWIVTFIIRISHSIHGDSHVNNKWLHYTLISVLLCGKFLHFWNNCILRRNLFIWLWYIAIVMKYLCFVLHNKAI